MSIYLVFSGCLLCFAQASGKLIVLDQLLKKLHAAGHRVLLFAQMTHTLDILQVNYLQSLNLIKQIVSRI